MEEKARVYTGLKRDSDLEFETNAFDRFSGKFALSVDLRKIDGRFAFDGNRIPISGLERSSYGYFNGKDIKALNAMSMEIPGEDDLSRFDSEEGFAKWFAEKIRQEFKDKFKLQDVSNEGVLEVFDDVFDPKGDEVEQFYKRGLSPLSVAWGTPVESDAIYSGGLGLMAFYPAKESLEAHKAIKGFMDELLRFEAVYPSGERKTLRYRWTSLQNGYAIADWLKKKMGETPFELIVR